MCFFKGCEKFHFVIFGKTKSSRVKKKKQLTNTLEEINENIYLYIYIYLVIEHNSLNIYVYVFKSCGG